MKIMGLFIIVFLCLGINSLLGFSDIAVYGGAIVGAGVYIINLIDNHPKTHP